MLGFWWGVKYFSEKEKNGCVQVGQENCFREGGKRLCIKRYPLIDNQWEGFLAASVVWREEGEGEDWEGGNEGREEVELEEEEGEWVYHLPW